MKPIGNRMIRSTVSQSGLATITFDLPATRSARGQPEINHGNVNGRTLRLLANRENQALKKVEKSALQPVVIVVVLAIIDEIWRVLKCADSFIPRGRKECQSDKRPGKV